MDNASFSWSYTIASAIVLECHIVEAVGLVTADSCSQSVALLNWHATCS